MKYVIIGNSIAAIGCVEGIRQIDKTSKILIISDEPYHVYSRPLISYLLCCKTDMERMKYRPNDFYTQNKCETMLGTKAVSIDHAAKTVAMDNGQTVDYDKLLISTGSRPFIPEAKGYDSIKNTFTFMTLDDALALDAAITKDSRVLIVGAGLIGLKCAEGILGKARDVIIMDYAPRVLPSILDKDGSTYVLHHLEQCGLRFILGAKADRFSGNTAHLSNGEAVKFDILVMAAGVKPNVELFSGTKNRGIVTNERCETSIEGIYAAGDCTESMDVSSNAQRILALLPNAYMQGQCAGINMAGGSMEYTKAIPMNSLGLMGMHMVTAGSYEGDEYTVASHGGYKKLFVRDDRLVGYIIIGDVRRAGIYTALIREQTPLCNIDFELIKEKPQLMAFSRKERQRQLGGMV